MSIAIRNTAIGETFGVGTVAWRCPATWHTGHSRPVRRSVLWSHVAAAIVSVRKANAATKTSRRRQSEQFRWQSVPPLRKYSLRDGNNRTPAHLHAHRIIHRLPCIDAIISELTCPGFEVHLGPFRQTVLVLVLPDPPTGLSRTSGGGLTRSLYCLLWPLKEPGMSPKSACCAFDLSGFSAPATRVNKRQSLISLRAFFLLCSAALAHEHKHLEDEFLCPICQLSGHGRCDTNDPVLLPRQVGSTLPSYRLDRTTPAIRAPPANFS